MARACIQRMKMKQERGGDRAWRTGEVEAHERRDWYRVSAYWSIRRTSQHQLIGEKCLGITLWEGDHLHSSTHILRVDIPSLRASWVVWSRGYSLSGCYVPCQVKILWSRLDSWIVTHEQETRNGGRMRLWQYSRNWKIWLVLRLHKCA